MSDRHFPPPRLALRPKEAAEALGISERALRKILPEIPHLRIGGAVLLPVAELEAWLRERAGAEGKRAAGIADEILEQLDG